MTKRTYLTFEEWLDSQFLPIAGSDGEGDEPSGAAGEGDSPGGGEGSAGGEGSTGSGEGDEPAGSGGDAPSAGGEGDEPADADDDELDRIRRERDDARTALAKAEAAAQKAKQDARKAREEAAKKGGNWEQVAKERESELAEANERAQSSEQRAIKAEEDLDAFRREVRITRIASKLSFRDPSDAMAQLKDKPEATGDDKSCERALRELSKQKPYLIDERRARGRAMNGAGNGSGMLTKEQMEKMTPEEINDAWEKGVIQQSLSGGG